MPYIWCVSLGNIKDMQLSIIILNYNVRYFLELCLKSVSAAISTLDAEIIVVDNNSSDDSCEMVKQQFPEVLLIENELNSGFSKGNNIGVSHAKGKYVCILNPDTVVPEDAFSQLIEFAENQTNLGIVGCRLIDGTGKYLPESKRNIPKPRVAFKKLLGNPNDYYANQLEEHDIGKAPIFVGAFMLLKKTVYEQVNGFDEDYFMYGEDIDLSYKILKAGYDNYYYGKTTVIHFKGESTLKDTKYAQRFYGAMQIFYKKHFKSNLAFNIVVWLGIKAAYLIRTNPKAVNTTSKHLVLISNKIPEHLQIEIKKPIELREDLENVKPNTEIIFDTDMLAFKSIIAHIEAFSNMSNTTFKILVAQSNFVLGSNSSKTRGEVIVY